MVLALAGLCKVPWKRIYNNWTSLFKVFHAPIIGWFRCNLTSISIPGKLFLCKAVMTVHVFLQITMVNRVRTMTSITTACCFNSVSLAWQIFSSSTFSPELMRGSLKWCSQVLLKQGWWTVWGFLHMLLFSKALWAACFDGISVKNTICSGCAYV